MVWVEIGFMDWVCCGVYLDVFEWVVLNNGMGRSGLGCVGVGWNGCFVQNCVGVKSQTLKLKISHSHYKISSKSIEMCWR
jgi:hypothetical protein